MEAREGAISLFVENLPERLYRKGLWFAFARCHGPHPWGHDQRTQGGPIRHQQQPGGPGRHQHPWDSLRCHLLHVGPAPCHPTWPTPRCSRSFLNRYGNKITKMKNFEEANRVTQRLNGATLYGSRLVVKIARNNQGEGWKRNTTERSQSTEYKKTGIGMDDEAIVQKVIEMGIGDINVQRLGAKTYLLTIMDEELSQMLEDINWSYLKEILSDVIPWSEKTSYSERATSLEIRGLPLHSTVLISTNQVKRVDEVIEVEIGDRVFQVGVKEIGFNDGTSYPLCNQWKKEGKSCEKSDESVEVLNVMCPEKDHIKCLNREKENCGDKIMEAELIGGVSKDEKLTGFHVNGDEESNKKVCTPGHDEKIGVTIVGDENEAIKDLVSLELEKGV
ncbi:hypothetical protein V6N13_018350 [Hibiscus sabdariffa]